MIDVEKISGIEDYVKVDHDGDVLYMVPNGKAFLVLGNKTLQVRTDRKLNNLLRDKYETVMESRYFGRGGIEIIPTGQLEPAEIEDLVRLSYNMTREEQENEQAAE